MKFIQNFIGRLRWVNAMQRRANGKFILVNTERLKSQALRILRDQEKYVLRQIKGKFPMVAQNAIRKNAIEDMDDIADNIPYQKELSETVVVFSRDSAKKGAKTVIAKWNLGQFGIGYEQVEPRIETYLSKKLTHELSPYRGNIHSTTTERIRQILYDGYKNGSTYGEMSKLIQEQGEAGVFSPARAEMIAVHEVGDAYEEGNYIPLKQLQEENPDRKVQKMWSTVGDDRVTPTHSENEAMGWIPFDEAFSGTGDQRPPATDNPRCRCTLLEQII